jgi:DNA-binding PadR family transcriptional regulator
LTAPDDFNYSAVDPIENAMSHRLGDFELRILMALVRLGTEAYGVTIRDDIEGRTGRTASAGALYTALNRMEKRGFVASRLGEPTAERGGKRKRLYTARPAGERALAEAYESLRLMASGLGARLRTEKG